MIISVVVPPLQLDVRISSGRIVVILSIFLPFSEQQQPGAAFGGTPKTPGELRIFIRILTDAPQNFNRFGKISCYFYQFAERNSIAALSCRSLSG
jgi:hypothetical protein